MRRSPGILIAGLVLIAMSFRASAQRPAPSGVAPTPAEAPVLVSPLGRGVNFGNMLEAPFEGAWGLTVEERFFDATRDAGLAHIRLPVSWTHHARATTPYTIEPAFMDRVEWCVDQALARGLKIIVNTHHYDELNADPAAETPRALAIWGQIAARFADRPVDRVYFEVLNEPHGAFNDDPAMWDAYLAQAIGVIRAGNPDRWILAGPVRWNAIGALHTFNAPPDRRLMLTVHHYEPFAFTHQGAEWVDPSPPVGTEWTGDAFTIATPWDNWSWGTTVTPVAGGLSIEYLQGWAGLFFHRGSPATDARRVVFTVDRAMNLNVVVGNDDEQQAFPVQTGPGGGEYTVDLPPGFMPVDRVILQNATPDAQQPWTLSSIRLESGPASTPEALVTTERGALEAAIRLAARWGRERGLPVHLGEFGVYNPADMDSRARWTRAVRESAERNGMAWAYWELAAGFGFFDPQAGAFRAPLLDALTD